MDIHSDKKTDIKALEDTLKSNILHIYPNNDYVGIT